MADDTIIRQAAINHLKNRLIETAINNVGIMVNADDVYREIAENRIDAWINEISTTQPEPCEDVVPRTSVEYICRKNTVSTNPYEHKYHDKFMQFMDDPEISDFGRWQHSNGFNTALVAVKCDLDRVPSAQPNVPDTNVGDMISRQAAIDVLRTCYDTEAITYTNGKEYIDYDQALDLMENLPSAQPEITEDDVKEYCRKRCLIVVTSDFYEEMMKRWSQPERKNGKWIPVTNGRGGHECSLCHSYAPSFQTGDEWLTDYCPCCGSDMREGEKG